MKPLRGVAKACSPHCIFLQPIFLFSHSIFLLFYTSSIITRLVECWRFEGKGKLDTKYRGTKLSIFICFDFAILANVNKLKTQAYTLT